MQTIITVTGAENTGKTTFIKYIFFRLIKQGAEIIHFESIGHAKQDFHAIILWNSRIIGFYSAGDLANPDWSIITEGLDFAEKYNASILINALSIGSGLTVGGYENLLNKRYGTKSFEKIMITKRLSKIIRKIKFKRIMKYIKDCLPCCFLNLHYLNQKKQKHLLIHKHRFSSYALITIIITIMANTILTSLSRNNLCFIIFSSIISICLSIDIIVSFFMPKKKTKYKAKILSDDLSCTEAMIIQNQAIAKELAEVHKSTANAMADI